MSGFAKNAAWTDVDIVLTREMIAKVVGPWLWTRCWTRRMSYKNSWIGRSSSCSLENYPPLTIFINEADGEELLVTIERSTKMETLFQAFAENHGWDVTTIQFTLHGETVQNDDTPESSLGLHDILWTSFKG